MAQNMWNHGRMCRFGGLNDGQQQFKGKIHQKPPKRRPM